VSEEAFATASQAVTEARAAIEQGVLIREAREAKARADQFAGLASQLRADAERLRDAAKATDTVLSDAVASDTLWVEDGRLMVKHDARGKCPFGPIPQHAYEGLDPDNRRLIHETARELRVNILTAEAANGELRAETYGETTT
jgi:hypothetical protein